MKKALLFLSIPLVFQGLIFSQVPIGYYHDLDARPIHGYYDPLDYSPQNQLTINHFSDGYEKGTVYFQNGSVKTGLIQFENKKIGFKKGNEKRIKIRPEEVIGLKIGVDSFFVTSNFNVEQKMGASLRTGPEFMQYLTSFEGLTFARHHHFSSSFAQSYGMASDIIQTYYVQLKDSDVWTSFPRRSKAFKKMAPPFFKHVPYLEEKILSGDLDYDDMITLIKTSEYYIRYRRKQKIYFDAYWQEVKKKDNWIYHGVITQFQDSIWTIEYYDGETKVRSAQFSSFYPNRKNGLFENYYTNGTGRSLKSYENNELVIASTFHPNGTMHYEYVPVKIYDAYGDRMVTDYLEAKTPGGRVLSKGNEPWTETVEDTITGRKIFNQFFGAELTLAYRMKGDRKIYQVVDPTYVFKVDPLQKKISAYFEDTDWKDLVAENVQGTLFIAVVINEKGQAESFNLLNNVHPKLDEQVKKWASLYLQTESTYRFKFKPYKLGKEKVYAEFVIPIQFNIHKFYRRPVNYYYDWQFHHFMFQQQMNVPINSPPIPPARF